MRHLVNAYEVEAGTVKFAGNTVWSVPVRFWGGVPRRGAISSVLTFTFTLTHIPWLRHENVFPTITGHTRRTAIRFRYPMLLLHSPPVQVFAISPWRTRTERDPKILHSLPSLVCNNNNCTTLISRSLHNKLSYRWQTTWRFVHTLYVLTDL